MNSQHSTDVLTHHRSVISHNTTHTQIRFTQNYGLFTTYELNQKCIAIDFATHCKNANSVRLINCVNMSFQLIPLYNKQESTGETGPLNQRYSCFYICDFADD